MDKVKYDGGEYDVKLGKYYDGHIHIALMMDDGQQYMSCTSNVDNLKDDEVAIREYDGEESITDALIEADIVAAPHRYERSGFIILPVCHLSPLMRKRMERSNNEAD